MPRLINTSLGFLNVVRSSGFEVTVDDANVSEPVREPVAGSRGIERHNIGVRRQVVPLMIGRHRLAIVYGEVCLRQTCSLGGSCVNRGFSSCVELCRSCSLAGGGTALSEAVAFKIYPCARAKMQLEVSCSELHGSEEIHDRLKWGSCGGFAHVLWKILALRVLAFFKFH